MTTAKICGLKTPDAVAAALAGGASYLGFMFFEKSPRNIDPPVAFDLARPARGTGTKIVAVTVDPTDAQIDRIVSALHPDLIQLHGAESPSRIQAIAARS